uniref:DnaJ homolog subfamily C member 1 n=2 Tax=Clastoptera arizonana TaxID=38151 RepID=A0A1B6EAW0_9HEMI
MQVLKKLIFFLITFCFQPCFSWDGDELEVFDVVEEVNQNFYTLLDVPQDADQNAIKKAFRKLSLVLHPDKNDAPDAEVKFRQLVSVYDILKDPNKRRCYNDVLQNGLPNWKQAVYYYRRVRKMGVAEMIVILFIIVSIGQYLVGWASYFEKKYTYEEVYSSKTKRLLKKQKKGKADGNLPPEFAVDFYTPSVKDTLPCQIPRLIWFLLVTAPPLTYQWLKDYLEERQLRRQLEAEEQEESEEEPEVPRAPRRRKVGFTVPELKDEPVPSFPSVDRSRWSTTPVPRMTGGLWSDDDLKDLTKFLKKYPVGTLERWEKIGEAMGRPSNEVVIMAHKLSQAIFRDMDGKKINEDNSEEEIVPEVPKKVKTKGVNKSEAENDTANWTSAQQSALESALLRFPKGSAGDRWEKIGNCVPEKTKLQCQMRYKYLANLVKEKREKEDVENNSESSAEGITKKNTRKV